MADSPAQNASSSSPGTPAADSNGVPPTPSARRSSKLPSLPPPMTPLVQSVSAKAMADAEKKLSTLRSEIDALKAREEEREYGLTRRSSGHLARPPSTHGGQMFTAYPDFHEDADYGETITEAERKRMRQELDMHYRIRKDQMFKQMQVAFRQKQLELERRAPKQEKKKKKTTKKGKERRVKNAVGRWGDYGSHGGDYDSSSEEEDSQEDEESDESEDDWKKTVSSPWNHQTSYDELKAARAKVDVVVCTTEHVPGFRIVEKLGIFKVVVPRSLLTYDESEEEVQNAFEMAKMVRQEVMDKAVGQARRRRANAVIDFRYKTELSQNINDDNVVLITATGKCCVVRRLLSEREQLMRRQMEESRKRYRRDKDVSILRQVLDKNNHESERKAHARALSQMDERDLRAFLDELQGKRKAEQASARQKADPHRDALEKLLGQKVRFDSDPYGGGGGRTAGPPGRGREASAKMVEELLMNILGNKGPPAGLPTRDNWQTKVTEDDAESRGDPEVWEAYDL